MSTVTSDAEKGTRHHHDYTSGSPTHTATAVPAVAGAGTAAAAANRQFANPGPLGLCAFALTTFVLSLINLQTRSVTIPNIVIGLAFFYGGLVQLLAGIGEFFVGNTFGATALSSYGGFWLSYAAILVPSFNSAAPYTAAAANGSGSATEFKTAVSFFLFGWFIFTFLMLVAVLRHSIAFIFLFTTLDMAFLMLALGEYLAKEALIKAGGVFGLLAAFAAWYCAMAQMLTQDNSFFTIPTVSLQKKAI
ncbi:hypothetical protein FRB91_009741 [Serendipita sp. 411]|nr:hypothetical protein FRB91_009741 [Serendipita sp. 411]